MLTLTNAQLKSQAQLQTRLVHMHLDDMTHAESCIAPVGGNSANWVLGHLIVSRDEIIGLLGGQRGQSAALNARYGAGSQAIAAAADDVVDLATLLTLWDEQAPQLYAQIEAATPELYAQEVTRRDGSKTTLSARIAFYLLFHESFHLGQLEYTRHAAGKHAGLI
ncbi:MAG: DinB family protein [Anaerolineae bacterium]|nr:DinB family protein [Anaerolineae bacterium]